MANIKRHYKSKQKDFHNVVGDQWTVRIESLNHHRFSKAVGFHKTGMTTDVALSMNGWSNGLVALLMKHWEKQKSVVEVVCIILTLNLHSTEFGFLVLMALVTKTLISSKHKGSNTVSFEVFLRNWFIPIDSYIIVSYNCLSQYIGWIEGRCSEDSGIDKVIEFLRGKNNNIEVTSTIDPALRTD